MMPTERRYKGQELLRIGERNIQRDCALEYLHGYHSALRSDLVNLFGSEEKHIGYNGAKYCFNLGNDILSVKFLWDLDTMSVTYAVHGDESIPKIYLSNVAEMIVSDTELPITTFVQDDADTFAELTVSKSGLERAFFKYKKRGIEVEFKLIK